MLTRSLAAIAFVAASTAALAQQQASPEIQAASQMLQQAQAQEFTLRVELAKLHAENEKLKAAAAKPAVKPDGDAEKP